MRKSFPAQPSALAAVRAFARRQADESGLPAKQGEEVAAAVEQAFAGALSQRSGEPVEVRVRVLGERIEVDFLSESAEGSGPRAAMASISFASWLGQQLKNRGLSQEAAARRIGVSLKTVSRWVRGETEPRFRELGLIQSAFGEQPQQGNLAPPDR
jgi:anti-sigma regulatory factor (Ser/Thr protein kinase)